MSPMRSPGNAYVVAIDDDRKSLEMVSSALSREDVQVVCATSGAEGMAIIRELRPRAVILDMGLPGIRGLDVITEILDFDPTIEVTVITGDDNVAHAVEALHMGASDYLVKPVPINALRERVHAFSSRPHDEGRDRNFGEICSPFQGMVGNSPPMWEMFDRIRRVAHYYQSVLVQGPTGSGKELVARALHDLSPVAQGHFVALNCSAVVETLFESELFGHVRGAFTGANSDKTGLFEHAHNGTLFLDEVGDMPLATQSKLLRSLQNREVQKLGSLTSKKVNVRVVAATHRDLRAAIAAGQFREDLFYRLAVVEIRVPSLAERDGDLPHLIHWLIQRFAEQFGKPLHGCTQRVLSVLSRHNWPGNVRELENVIGNAAIMTSGDMIDVYDLPDYLRCPEPAAVLSLEGRRSFDAALPSLYDQERRLLEDALRQSGNNQSKAARALRITRDTLRYRIKRYGIQ